MSNPPPAQGDVLRRNAERECGAPIGQINVKVKGLLGLQTISFYCNKLRLHTDGCEFVGADVRVMARRRDDSVPIVIGRR